MRDKCNTRGYFSKKGNVKREIVGTVFNQCAPKQENLPERKNKVVIVGAVRNDTRVADVLERCKIAHKKMGRRV